MVFDVWVEVDLAALRHNLKQVRGTVGEGTKLMAVVKANGFGHGYVEPSRAFLEAGADALAVTRLEEALPIRDSGITAPILLFAPIQIENAEAAVEADLDMTVTDIALAKAISTAAQRLGRAARVHVKIDTGMGRLGVLPGSAVVLVKEIAALPSVQIAGTYTHFATAAESDLTACRKQLAEFQALAKRADEAGVALGSLHAANSAAILRLPESHLDMVRPGTLLYGQYPSQHVPHSLDLRPTWRLRARICEIKELDKGSPVGYGGEYTTRHRSRIAIVPVGYADGFTLVPEGPIYRQSVMKFAGKKIRRALSAEVRGRKVPVVGRVAMQMTALDVTDVPEARVGDVVAIPAMRIPTSALIPRVCVESFS